MKFLSMEKHSKEILDAACLDLAVSLASIQLLFCQKLTPEGELSVFLVLGKENPNLTKTLEEESHRRPSTRLQNLEPLRPAASWILNL